MIELLPHQVEGVEFITERESVLLADSMGLGKTAQAIQAMLRNQHWLPAVVVCPASLKYNWRDEFWKNGSRLPVSVCDGREPPAKTSEFDLSVSPVHVINYSILPYWVDYFKSIGVRTVVFDEIQDLTNPKAKKTKAAQKLSAFCDRSIGLSGTPLYNRPIELWPIANMLWPGKLGGFRDYTERYCDARLMPWGWDYSGASNLDELHHQLYGLGMLRRKKSALNLPPKTRKIETVAVDDDDEYNLCRDDYESWLMRFAPERRAKALKAKKLTQIGNLMRLSSRLKMRSVISWVNSFLHRTDEKIVLFAYHKKAINLLQRHINAKCVSLTGSTMQHKRQMVVDQFQNDPETRVFIGNLIAASTGITLTAARVVAMCELYYRPIDLLQAEDRVWRIGQTRPSWIYYLVANNTLEPAMCRLLQQKQDIISAILDGDMIGEIDDFNIHEELQAELNKDRQWLFPPNKNRNRKKQGRVRLNG